MKASERILAHVRLPEDQCAKSARAKDLLRGPKGIRCLRCANHVERRVRQLPVRRRLRMEGVRRL